MIKFRYYLDNTLMIMVAVKKEIVTFVFECTLIIYIVFVEARLRRCIGALEPSNVPSAISRIDLTKCKKLSMGRTCHSYR